MTKYVIRNFYLATTDNFSLADSGFGLFFFVQATSPSCGQRPLGCGSAVAGVRSRRPTCHVRWPDAADVSHIRVDAPFPGSAPWRHQWCQRPTLGLSRLCVLHGSVNKHVILFQFIHDNVKWNSLYPEIWMPILRAHHLIYMHQLELKVEVTDIPPWKVAVSIDCQRNPASLLSIVTLWLDDGESEMVEHALHFSSYADAFEQRPANVFHWSRSFDSVDLQLFELIDRRPNPWVQLESLIQVRIYFEIFVTFRSVDYLWTSMRGLLVSNYSDGSLHVY